MAPPKTTNAPRGTIRGASSHNLVTFVIRATPLPQIMIEFILENLIILKQFQHERRAGDSQSNQDATNAEDQDEVDNGDIGRRPKVKPEQFWAALQDKCRETGGEWEDIADRIWAFGPHNAGGCILIDSRKTAPHSSALATYARKSTDGLIYRLKRRLDGLDRPKSEETDNDAKTLAHDFDNHVETGFQLATFQGPLCAEPVEGMAYFVESIEMDTEGVEKEIGMCPEKLRACGRLCLV